MERTVNPLASVRSRYFSGAISNGDDPGAVCARAEWRTPKTALVKTTRISKRDKIVFFTRFGASLASSFAGRRNSCSDHPGLSSSIPMTGNKRSGGVNFNAGNNSRIPSGPIRTGRLLIRRQNG